MNEPCVISEEIYSGGDWLDGNVHDFIAWLNEQLLTVPEAHRKDVRFDFHSGDDYDSAYLTLSYDRSETDDEVLARVERLKENSRRIEAKERIQLARLQQKYGKR